MSRHSMACLSWSPSSLPGGVIGAREQPQRGPNNEEPTVGPAPAAMSDLEVNRCSVDGIGVQRTHGVCVIDDDGAIVKTWLVEHTESELAATVRSSSPSSATRRLLPIAIERGEGLVVGTDRSGGPSGAGWSSRQPSRPRVHGGARPARSRISVMRSCSPTTPEPTVTDLRRVEPVAAGHPGARRAGPGTHLAGRGTHRGVESAVGDPRRALAWRWRGVPEADLADRAGVLDRLPDAACQRRCSARDGCVSSAADTAIEAASPPPSCSAGCALRPPARTRSRRTVLAAIVRRLGRPDPACSTRRSPISNEISPTALAAHPKTAVAQDVAPRGQRQPRAADRRDRAAAGTMRQPRTGRRDVRRRAGHPGIRQVPHRRVPLHREQAGPRRDHRLRRQLPTLLGLGRRLATGEHARAVLATHTPSGSSPEAGSA